MKPYISRVPVLGTMFADKREPINLEWKNKIIYKETKLEKGKNSVKGGLIKWFMPKSKGGGERKSKRLKT